MNGRLYVHFPITVYEPYTNRPAQAPGEAEAELAFLNRAGYIDAVLSDDVDTFVFGATMVVRK